MAPAEGGELKLWLPLWCGAAPFIRTMIWRIYYTAGTLVYTSIMAVTVIELFVWVCVSVGAAISMRLLAFYLCMCYEDKVEGEA